MADNGTFSTGLEGFGVLGTLIGTFVKAGAERAASDAAQATFRTNQAIAIGAARAATSRGNFEGQRAVMQGSQVIGKEKAAYAASGVVANKGSAADVEGETRAISDIDAQTLRNNAAREAWGYATQARNIGAQADYAKQAADFQEAATILGGAGSAGASMLKFGGIG